MCITVVHSSPAADNAITKSAVHGCCPVCDMLRILYFRKTTLAVVWVKQKLGMAGFETVVFSSGEEVGLALSVLRIFVLSVSMQRCKYLLQCAHKKFRSEK